jgi:hypothetical protein
MSFASVIGSAELAGLLRKAGAPDGQVPQSWNGARLRLQIGATVVASWRNVKEQASGGTAWSGLTLVQGPAPVVTAPAGFSLQAFAVAGLQAAGMRNRDRAVRLAQQATTAPALLAGYLTPYFYVDVREVNLHAGAATLIEEFGLASQEDRFGYSDGFPRMERLSLLWIARDRVYLLSGRTQTPPRMLSGDVAAALACMIDLANSI